MPLAQTTNLPFINRRKADNRRAEPDPCSNLAIDLFHRKRRKQIDRRQPKTLGEDYYAYLQALMATQPTSSGS